MSTKEAQANVDELPPLLDLEQAESTAEEIEMAPEPVESAEAQAAQKPVADAAANDGDSPIETVRDLLFGDAVRALRRELHLTVRNLRGTVKVVHREFKQRADELADQLSAMQLALDNEATEREELAGSVKGQLVQHSEQLQVKLHEQSDALDCALKQVNADMELHTNNQQHALSELEKKVFSALEEYAEEFRDGKMNRNEFAEMLASLAGKVGNGD